jgi:hypothetical protein
MKMYELQTASGKVINVSGNHTTASNEKRKYEQAGKKNLKIVEINK